MGKKLTVICDMDAVFVDLLGHWLLQIAQDHSVGVCVEDITKWSMHECPPLDRLGKGTVYGYLQKPGFFLMAPPILPGIEALRDLHEGGHRVLIATSPSGPVSAMEKLAWIQHHMPWFPVGNVIITHQKAVIRGDVLIEDHPDTLVEYASEWPEALVLGIEYPYNRHVGLDEGVIMAGSHKDYQEAWNTICENIEARANIQ